MAEREEVEEEKKASNNPKVEREEITEENPVREAEAKIPESVEEDEEE